jgi:YD repeat-containing protein
MEKKIKTIRRFNQQYQSLSFAEILRKADEEYLELVVQLDESGNTVSESKFNDIAVLEEKNEYTYDEAGRLKEHLLYYAIDEVTEQRVLKRDEKGRLIEETKYYGDDTGERMQYTYDANDRVSSIVRLDEEGDFDYREEIVYNENGGVLSRTKYDASGQVKESLVFEWREGGVVEEKEYSQSNELLSNTIVRSDDQGRELSSVQTNASGKLIAAVYSTYDEKGNLSERHYKDFYSKTLKYAYNDDNRLISQELFDGTGLLLRKNVYEYDVEGNLSAEQVFEIDTSRGGRDKHYGNRYEYEYY